MTDKDYLEFYYEELQKKLTMLMTNDIAGIDVMSYEDGHRVDISFGSSESHDLIMLIPTKEELSIAINNLTFDKMGYEGYPKEKDLLVSIICKLQRLKGILYE